VGSVSSPARKRYVPVRDAPSVASADQNRSFLSIMRERHDFNATRDREVLNSVQNRALPPLMPSDNVSSVNRSREKFPFISPMQYQTDFTATPQRRDASSTLSHERSTRWQVLANGWNDYDDDVDDKIQQCYDSGERKCKISVVTVEGRPPIDFTLDFQNMTQSSPMCEKARRIRPPFLKR